jgi:hypothetical protein
MDLQACHVKTAKMKLSCEWLNDRNNSARNVMKRKSSPLSTKKMELLVPRPMKGVPSSKQRFLRRQQVKICSSDDTRTRVSKLLCNSLITLELLVLVTDTSSSGSRPLRSDRDSMNWKCGREWPIISNWLRLLLIRGPVKCIKPLIRYKRWAIIWMQAVEREAIMKYKTTIQVLHTFQVKARGNGLTTRIGATKTLRCRCRHSKPKWWWLDTNRWLWTERISQECQECGTCRCLDLFQLECSRIPVSLRHATIQLTKARVKWTMVQTVCRRKPQLHRLSILSRLKKVLQA